MWISRKNYDKLKDDIYFYKRRIEENIRTIHYQETKILNLEAELAKKQATINYMASERQLNNRTYEVKIIITGHITLHYNIKTYSHEKAREIATEMFVKNNKDFSKKDIQIIETSVIE